MLVAFSIAFLYGIIKGKPSGTAVCIKIMDQFSRVSCNALYHIFWRTAERITKSWIGGAFF